MCGVAGIVVSEGQRIDPGELLRMSAALRHRGPDDYGYLVWSPGECARLGRQPDVGLARLGMAHRQLSILDLSRLGSQPMASPDGRHYLIYNGEVYNYVELRAELERAGRRFTTQTDTEVILAALTEWGLNGAISRFEGMYAFALLDTVAYTLTLARDPFGIKPLYYIRQHGCFAFASEIKALLSLGWTKPRPHPKAILEYLLVGRSDEGDETMFAGIRQVPPAGVFVLDVTGTPTIVSERSSWNPVIETPLDISYDAAVVLVRESFLGNISRHLRSAVPVGAALSGGIDSSSIVAGMRQAAPNLDLHTFCYFADDPALSEALWARAAAGAAGATVHEVRISPDALARDLDSLIRSQDEPFGSTSIYAQRCIFRSASEAGVRVMLDGQGADELMGGYASFLGPQVAALLSRASVRSAARLLQSSRGRTDVSVKEVLRYAAAASTPKWLKRQLSSRVHASAIPAWIDTEWFGSRIDSFRLDPPDPGPNLRAHLLSSVRTSLLSLLRYEDRNSMAFSVESRVPFLTTNFAELLLSLPDSYLIASNGTRKAVFRDAMRGLVPDVVLDRRDKVGFQTPERALLSGVGSWTAKVLESDVTRQLPCIDLDSIRLAAASAAAGEAGTSVPLWRLLNLIRWADLFDVEFA